MCSTGGVVDDSLQSSGKPDGPVNPPPPRQPWLLGVRVAIVNLALLFFLVSWPPRHDSPAAAGRASWPRPAAAAAAAEKELTLKDDDARQSGRAGRPPRQSRRRHRHRRRLAHSLMTLCAVSTLILLISVIVAISTWHPGGWPPL